MKMQAGVSRIGEFLHRELSTIGLSMGVRSIDLGYSIEFRSIVVKKQKTRRKFLGIPFRVISKTEVADFYLDKRGSEPVFVMNVKGGEFVEPLKKLTQQLEEQLSVPAKFIY